MNINLKNRYSLLIFAYTISFALLAGCEKSPAQRYYTEIFIDVAKPKTSSSRNPHDFLQMMPQDEIHANLNLQDSNIQQQLNNSNVPMPFNWRTPEQWVENKGSGMRLATFLSKDANLPIETTIVSLAGQAGTPSANVMRWMQQIQLNVPSTEELNSFINQQEKFETESGLPVLFIDFTQRQEKEKLNAPSMIAAIVERKDNTIFIKMTGTQEAVKYHREHLKALTQSLKINE